MLRANAAYPDWETVERVAACLRSGGLAAFPTDTLYGMGGWIFSREAADRVRRAKGLGEDSPLLLLLPAPEWADRLVSGVREPARGLMRRFWPGPLTLVLPASDAVPRWITAGRGTVALRMPADSAAAELVRALGAPLVATSANRHGESPAATGMEVAALFGRALDLVIDGGTLPRNAPSTVVDAGPARPRILRPGAIAEAAIEGCVGGNAGGTRS